MSFSPKFIFMAIFCVQSIAALLQNGFMVTFLGREWVQKKALPAGEMIVACLAASRFCLHGIAILSNFMISCMFWNKGDSIGIFWDFINTVSFWLTTWLAIFYCVKISSFTHPIFLWMKWRISQSVPRLLLGSLIIGGLSAISTFIRKTVTAQMMGFENGTLTQKVILFYQYYYRCHAMLMWAIPFFLFLLAIILLMLSLRRHVEQMRYHRPRLHDHSTQAHTMVLKSLAFFLIFYTAYVLFLVIFIVHVVPVCDSSYWAWQVVTYTGISLHSTIMILSSPKMRRALKMKFSYLCVAHS